MDPFALLTSGLKFDRSRFASDINRFKPGAAQHNAAGSQQQAAITSAPPQQPATHQGRKQKRKHPQPTQEEPSQGPGIDVFGKARATQRHEQADPSSEENEDASDELGEDELSVSEDLGSDSPAQSSDQDEDSEADSEDESDIGTDEEGDSGDSGSLDTEAAALANGRHTGHDRQGAGGADGIDPDCPVVATRDVLEAANVVRKHYRIKVAGDSPPAPLRSWAETAQVAAAAAGDSGQAAAHARRAAEKLAERLRDELFAPYPTPIQRQTVPCLLEGRDLFAVAPTGSGKTLAFLVPVLLGLKSVARTEGKVGEGGPHGPRALILSPTHELAAQQARVLRLLLPGSGLKGALLTKATATDNTFSKVDILLANPLRAATLSSEGQCDLSQIRYLVLDEADRLFEMGFITQIDTILAACSHKDITRALFSATLPDKVEQLARSVLVDPLRVTVGARNTANSSVKQRLLFVGRGEAGKLLALRQLLAGGLTPPVLVFVATKERAKALHRELLYEGVRVDSINAAQSNTVRAAAVDNFRSGRTWVLIATDLIGRGMDFIGVRTVVNFDAPGSTTDYIHRIGRTGRASQTGEAITLFTEEDAPLLRPIANLVKEAGGEVPEWMLHLKKVRTKDRKRRKLPDAVKSGATLHTRPTYDLKKKRRKHQAAEARKKAKGDKDGQPVTNGVTKKAGKTGKTRPAKASAGLPAQSGKEQKSKGGKKQKT